MGGFGFPKHRGKTNHVHRHFFCDRKDWQTLALFRYWFFEILKHMYKYKNDIRIQYTMRIIVLILCLACVSSYRYEDYLARFNRSYDSSHYVDFMVAHEIVKHKVLIGHHIRIDRCVVQTRHCKRYPFEAWQ